MALAVRVSAETFASKATELRDREAKLQLHIEVCSRERHEYADIAVKAFGLSQMLRPKWLTADYAAKRRILEIICLDYRLLDATLVPEMRRPFDVLIEGPSTDQSRGDWI